MAGRRRRDDGLSGPSRQPERQAAGRHRCPREPRAQRAYPRRRPPRGARGFRGAGARFPVAARRHARRRGQGTRDVQPSSVPEKPVEDGVATIAFLKDHELSTGKVGAIGFCWGGGTVNALAVASPDLSAAWPITAASPRRRTCRRSGAALLLHYAGQDERINAGIDAYKAALEAAGKDFTCSSTRAPSTPSTTTPRRPATTRTPPTWRGAAPSPSSRRSWPEAASSVPGGN